MAVRTASIGSCCLVGRWNQTTDPTLCTFMVPSLMSQNIRTSPVIKTSIRTLQTSLASPLPSLPSSMLYQYFICAPAVCIYVCVCTLYIMTSTSDTCLLWFYLCSYVIVYTCFIVVSNYNISMLSPVSGWLRRRWVGHCGHLTRTALYSLLELTLATLWLHMNWCGLIYTIKCE